MKLKVVISTFDVEPSHRRCRAEVPVLPGCVSEGGTSEEALANLLREIASYHDATELARSGSDCVVEIELSVGHDELLETRTDEPEGSVAVGKPRSSLRRFLMEHGRHESAALLALTAGLFAALACGTLALAPIWIGFLIGYLTMAGFAALVCTVDS
jgi:hypothetical protein